MKNSVNPCLKKTGTKQWADRNINIQIGCSNNCRYCYAAEMAVWFGRCTRENWHIETIDHSKVDKKYRKYEGVVMFPSAHDVTPSNLAQSFCVLRKLLDAGNQVLIVSKPRLACIGYLGEMLKEYLVQIEFRFTIGSTNDDVLRFWDREAPLFEKRLDCLKYTYYNHYVTSVSCEPYLDGSPLEVYEKTIDFCTGDFWLGKMNHFNKRVDLTGVTEEQMQRFVHLLQKLIDDDHVRELYEIFKDKPRVRFKDSFAKVVGL